MPSPWAVLRNAQTPIEAETPTPWAPVPEEPMQQSDTKQARVINHFGEGPGKAIPPVLQSRLDEPSPADQNIANTQEQLQKVRYAQTHPWGTPENHPGKLGKLAHVFSEVGNVAGNIVAPNVMERIPETQLGMKADEGRLAKRLDTEEEKRSLENEQAATMAHLNAETPEVAPNAESLRNYQGAEARHLDAETGQIGEPGPPEIHDTPMGLMAIDKKNATATPVTANGVPIGPKLDTTVAKGIISHTDGKPHAYIVDKQGNKIADLGVDYERPVTVNVGQKERGETLKLYQPASDSAERFNVMSKSYEDAVKNHDQQAMLNLLANHLGMTMGLQKGARITRDLYQEAAHSTPWLAKIGAKFDKDGYLSGVTLNPTQMRQMVDLARTRFAEDVVKARNEAHYLGATDDGPERIPSPATINHYIALANGDPNKAKQLAAQDGWSVK